MSSCFNTFLPDRIVKIARDVEKVILHCTDAEQEIHRYIIESGKLDDVFSEVRSFLQGRSWKRNLVFPPGSRINACFEADEFSYIQPECGEGYFLQLRKSWAVISLNGEVRLLEILREFVRSHPRLFEH